MIPKDNYTIFSLSSSTRPHKKYNCTCLENKIVFLFSGVKDNLLRPLGCETNECPVNKITVVGTGQVGMACVFSILTKVIFFY